MLRVTDLKAPELARECCGDIKSTVGCRASACGVAPGWRRSPATTSGILIVGFSASARKRKTV